MSENANLIHIMENFVTLKKPKFVLKVRLYTYRTEDVPDY